MEARELGLVTKDISPNSTRKGLMAVLTSVVNEPMIEGMVSHETINDAALELVSLQREETQISMELSSLRKRLSEMLKLKDSTFKVDGALQIQRERLNISGWIGEISDPNHQCPICGHGLEITSNQLKKLQQALVEIEKTAGDFATVPAAFDRELERVRGDINSSSEKLEAINIRRRSLEKSSDVIKRRRFEEKRISRFIGSLEESLHTYERVGEDSELVKEVEGLRQRVTALELAISEGQIRARQHRALERISGYAGKLLPALDVERPDDPISLSPSDLTVKIKGIDREDYLWEIGSGSNWLAYHVAISLALHQFFLSLSHSPVPSFIVYDQPSQVYFPKVLAHRDDMEQPDQDSKLRDEDVEAVNKVFTTISKVVGDSSGGLQAIVLDHAAENVWGEVKNLHVVEEWRDGNKLIPDSWLVLM